MSHRRLCQQCGRNRAERFYASQHGRICADCRRQNRSDLDHAKRLRENYGLTPEQYQALSDHQGGVCAICGQARRYRLNVDHDHATGLVRGLLCRRCNKLLRDVRDDRIVLRMAVRYLNRSPAEVIELEARVPSAGATRRESA